MTFAEPFDEFGLATTAQLRAAGISKGQWRANVKAQRWQRVLRDVYACFTGPLARPSKVMAALLYAGWPAVLSHRTAAEEWGFLKPDDDQPVHVTVPYTSSAVSCLPFVQLHRSRAFRFIRVKFDPMPRTISVATVVDLAVAEDVAAEAKRTLVSMAGRAGVSVWQLLHEMEVRKPRRHRKALKEAVAMYASGVTSALEYEYAAEVEVAHGLPPAARQTPFEVDGRTLYEDVTYDHLGVALTIRLDGKEHHSIPGIAFRDRRRDNAAELKGRSRLVYGWHDVHNDPCAVAQEVLTVLRRNGWRGTVKPCFRCVKVVSG